MLKTCFLQREINIISQNLVYINFILSLILKDVSNKTST